MNSWQFLFLRVVMGDLRKSIHEAIFALLLFSQLF